MAQFTPSALTFQSLGSMNLTVAHVNADVISGTNYWASGITDIKSIMPAYWSGALMCASGSVLSVSWTATTGTIHLVNDASVTDTGYIFWVLSGGPSLKA